MGREKKETKKGRKRVKGENGMEKEGEKKGRKKVK